MGIPLVSVILPTYNAKPEWIQLALESLLSQTFEDFECIVVDDASTNNIEAIIRTFTERDQRIHYISNTVNLERSASKNKGIAVSRGKYIAFIDDDDIWSNTEKLQKQIEFLEAKEEYVLCGTDLKYVDEHGVFLYEVITKKSDDSIRKSLLGSNQFAHSTVVIRKAVLEKSGAFNEKYYLAEDYDLWLRIGKYGKLCNLDCIGISYRNRNTNTSNKNRLKLRMNSLLLSLSSMRYYPNRLRGLLAQILVILLPESLTSKLIKIYNSK